MQTENQYHELIVNHETKATDTMFHMLSVLIN